MDRRSTPATARVALTRLSGQIDRPAFTEGTTARVAVAVADLLRAPDGARERQLLRGEDVLVIDREAGHAFVEAHGNGYCGWLSEAALTEARPPLTHRVAAAATHIYPGPDMKLRETGWLSLGSRVAVAGTEGRFARLDGGGFVPLQALAEGPEADPAAVAQRLIGTPYLWGGDSRAGIDCSGLVHAALTACGIACPGDSDQQAAAFPVVADADIARGDLLFWRGHVAMALAPDRMIHATAHTMSVVEEGIAEARARITDPYLGARRPAG